MYRVVSRENPHGQGSIAMLERLLSFWKGKVFMLCLLAFVATSWIITITLSASDSAVHSAENPLAPSFLREQEVLITLVLLTLLGTLFLMASERPHNLDAGRTEKARDRIVRRMLRE